MRSKRSGLVITTVDNLTHRRVSPKTLLLLDFQLPPLLGCRISEKPQNRQLGFRECEPSRRSVNRGKTFSKARRKTLHLAYIQPPTYLLRLVTVVPNW